MGSWPVRLFLLLVLALQLPVKTASVTSDLPPVQHRAATAAGSDEKSSKESSGNENKY